jgi:hypothetical protein
MNGCDLIAWQLGLTEHDLCYMHDWYRDCVCSHSLLLYRSPDCRRDRY